MREMLGTSCRRVFTPRTLATFATLVLSLASAPACKDTGRVSGGACSINQDCPTGEQCVGGHCVEAMNVGCKNDDACDVGEFCNPDSKQCESVTVTGCSTDDVCPPSQRCNTCLLYTSDAADE